MLPINFCPDGNDIVNMLCHFSVIKNCSFKYVMQMKHVEISAISLSHKANVYVVDRAFFVYALGPNIGMAGLLVKRC